MLLTIARQEKKHAPSSCTCTSSTRRIYSCINIPNSVQDTHGGDGWAAPIKGSATQWDSNVLNHWHRPAHNGQQVAGGVVLTGGGGVADEE